MMIGREWSEGEDDVELIERDDLVVHKLEEVVFRQVIAVFIHSRRLLRRPDTSLVLEIQHVVDYVTAWKITSAPLQAVRSRARKLRQGAQEQERNARRIKVDRTGMWELLQVRARRRNANNARRLD